MQLKKTLQHAIYTASLTLLMALPAFALELGEAKSSGLVGETNTGYIAAIKSSSEVDALVANINRQRKAQYQGMATENKISLKDIEALAGKKAIDKTPAGQLINTGAGWQKK